MRILLKLELDCTPNAAWRAIRTPAVLEKVSAPFTGFTSLERDGFPEVWQPGDHRVLVRAFGLMDVGTQNIGISFPQRRDGVRVLRDSGPPLTGPLAIITRWQHQLAVSATARWPHPLPRPAALLCRARYTARVDGALGLLAVARVRSAAARIHVAGVTDRSRAPPRDDEASDCRLS